MSEISVGKEIENQIHDDVGNLRKSLYFGADAKLVAAFSDMPSPLHERWTNLIYRETGGNDLEFSTKTSSCSLKTPNSIFPIK